MKRRRRLSPLGKVSLFLLLLAGGVLWAWHSFSDSRIAVALDAGHGGADVGAQGYVEEKDLTEATVRRLQELLEADPAYRVILCRELDRGTTLNSRWRKANEGRAELLISVHGNAADTWSATGFEVYPSPPGREHHEESLRFAGLLARRMAETGIGLRGEDGIRYAYYVDGEKVFREPSDAPLDEPSFAMVDYPKCPAVLAEQGFVTNPADMELLGSQEGCRLAARKYYLAICDYFGTEPLPEE